MYVCVKYSCAYELKGGRYGWNPEERCVRMLHLYSRVFSCLLFNLLMTGVPHMRYPEKNKIAERSASVTLYRGSYSDSAVGQPRG